VLCLFYGRFNLVGLRLMLLAEMTAVFIFPWEVLYSTKLLSMLRWFAFLGCYGDMFLISKSLDYLISSFFDSLCSSSSSFRWVIWANYFSILLILLKSISTIFFCRVIFSNLRLLLMVLLLTIFIFYLIRGNFNPPVFLPFWSFIIKFIYIMINIPISCIEIL